MKALVSCIERFVSRFRAITPAVQAPKRLTHAASQCLANLLSLQFHGTGRHHCPCPHVVEQPDSPVEILAIDFKDSWLSVADERETRAASLHHENPQPERPTDQGSVPSM